MTSISAPANATCPTGHSVADYGSLKWRKSLKRSIAAQAQLTVVCNLVTWAPIYKDMLNNISLDCLSNQLQQLPIDRRNRDFLSGFCVICEDVVNCIQAQLTEGDKSAFGSSQVILGITPTLLAVIAPTLGELSMLSSSRPLLSLLVSLGAPASFCSRTLAYDDPLDSLVPTRTVFTRSPFKKGGPSPRTIRAALSMFEYLITMVAVGNVIHASWTLGQETILSWNCLLNFLPFVWTTLSFIPPMIASLSWHFSATMKTVRSEGSQSRGLYGVSSFRRWITSEFRLSAVSPKRGFLKHREEAEGRLVVFANIFAQIGSLILVLFGTWTLSALLLIGARDALYYILRFYVSAMVCRIVIMFELSGMSAVENEGEEKLIEPEPVRRVGVHFRGKT